MMTVTAKVDQRLPVRAGNWKTLHGCGCTASTNTSTRKTSSATFRSSNGGASILCGIWSGNCLHVTSYLSCQTLFHLSVFSHWQALPLASSVIVSRPLSSKHFNSTSVHQNRIYYFDKNCPCWQRLLKRGPNQTKMMKMQVMRIGRIGTPLWYCSSVVVIV